MATISNVSQFSPRQVSGCVGWFDGKDPLGTGRPPITGTSISTWVDKSGQANNAITVGSNPTYNSNGYIFFNGSNTLKFTSPDALVANNTFSIFLVEQRDNVPTSNIRFWLGGTATSANTNLHFGYRTSNIVTLAFYANDYNIGVASPITNEPFRVWGGIWDGTSKFIYLNGTGFSSAATGNLTSWSNGSIGYYAPTLNFYTGNIAEIIFFKPTINNSNRQQVEGYLAWKWGLQSSLPTTHPFYTNPFITNLPITPIVLPFAERTNYSLVPSQIPGCALWLDAADANSITQSNGNVSVWRDKTSAYVGTAVPTTTIQYVSNTLNGLPVIRISTAAYFNFGNINNITTEEFNIFAVINTTNTAVPGGIIGKATGTNGWWFGCSGSVALQTQYGGTNTYTNTGLSGSYKIVSSMNPRTSATTHYSNGTSLGGSGNSTASISNTSELRVGSQGNTYTINNTDLAEVILYRGSITVDQRQQIEGYLAWKWGLQANLPTTHPFFRNPFIANLPITTSIANVYRITNRGFNPPTLPGMALWLDAADSTTVIRTGSSVTRWDDKSGNGKNAVSATSPTYNSVTNGIRFRSATTTTMNLPDGTIPSGNSSYSVFILMTLSSTPTAPNGVLYSGTSTFLNNQILGFYAGSTMNVTWHNNDLGMPTFPYNVNTRYIFTSTYASGSIRVNYTNGTQYASDTPGTRSSATTFNKIGAFYSNNTYPFDGEIYEIFVFSTALTTTQRQQTEGYLAWKWGLQKSLPTNHPFYLFPPG